MTAFGNPLANLGEEFHQISWDLKKDFSNFRIHKNLLRLWCCDPVVPGCKILCRSILHTASFQRRATPKASYYSDSAFYTMGSRGCLQATPVTNGATLFKSCKVMWRQSLQSHFNVSFAVFLRFRSSSFLFWKKEDIVNIRWLSIALVTHLIFKNMLGHFSFIPRWL